MVLAPEKTPPGRKHEDTNDVRKKCNYENCGRTFSSHKTLLEHIQNKHANYSCRKCDRVFKGKINRDNHEGECNEILARGLQGAERDDISQDEQFVCEFPRCGQRFNTIYERAEHIRMMHEDTDIDSDSFVGKKFKAK
ncbi:transcription factor IIIA-like protein [Leptotrombidium deliense]|uniref:Transcription factor IIIA-like protein n=1 Tax=Leptotrombidium deliense TaxID=299467 RepID=A0A443RZN8_9ACAR|nr:transcription factor IIIA-like protein [Leptotrombidium deliense]